MSAPRRDHNAVPADARRLPCRNWRRESMTRDRLNGGVVHSNDGQNQLTFGQYAVCASLAYETPGAGCAYADALEVLRRSSSRLIAAVRRRKGTSAMAGSMRSGTSGMTERGDFVTTIHTKIPTSTQSTNAIYTIQFVSRCFMAWSAAVERLARSFMAGKIARDGGVRQVVWPDRLPCRAVTYYLDLRTTRR